MAEILNNGQARTVRRAGNAMCLCPAHRDHTPSLGIRIGNGTLMYTCYAGCDFLAIARAIRDIGYNPGTGEQIRDDVRPPPPRAEGRTPDDVERLFQQHHRYDPLHDENWDVHPKANRQPEGGRLAARYVYRDTGGRPMMAVNRIETRDEAGKTHKVFVAISPWWNVALGRLEFPDRTAPEPRPGYGYETLVREGPVFAVEGEKCRDRLDELLGGTTAVVSFYGSAPQHADMTPLSGRTVVMLRDMDVPGLVMSERLKAVHDGPIVRVDSPWLGDGPAPEGWDVADAIEGKEGTKRLTPERFFEHLRRAAFTASPDDNLKIASMMRHLKFRRAVKG